MRIGTVGTGPIVSEFIRSVQILGNQANIQCIAVHSRQEAKALGLAGQFHIPKTYTDYQLMLQDPDLDFIYIASPNSLHFEQACQALQSGKHVICEKPLTSTVSEAATLIRLAREQGLFLFEAITTLHLPNYQAVQESICQLGQIKLVQCNYSQYSSRYTQLLAHEVTNIFDPLFSGGALADINIYNIHFVIGLFGPPRDVHYTANLAFNGIDTSGTVILKYDDFICACSGAKDSSSPGFAMIQGTNGYIQVDGPINSCPGYEIGIGSRVDAKNVQDHANRMVFELQAFLAIFENRDFERCHRLLEHSRQVVSAFVQARQDAGIVFAADRT